MVTSHYSRNGKTIFLQLVLNFSPRNQNLSFCRNSTENIKTAILLTVMKYRTLQTVD